MKKILLVAMVLLGCITAEAQSIISDEVKSSGVRVIVGETVAARDMKDKQVFFVGLSAINKGDSTLWNLAVKVIEWNAYRVNKGNILLIKTMNDDVIQLVADDDYDATVRNVHTEPFVYSDYSTVALYPISTEDIAKLCAGVKKIRQEVSIGDTHDKDYKKDKIGSIITAELKLIRNALNEKKTIYDGF
jgi:hypothetical protein